MSVTIEDHSKECEDEIQKSILLALETIGAVVAEKARDLAPVDTGALQADIRHEVVPDENAVYIGNTEKIPYAKYQELGTSKTKAHPYLKPAAIGSKEDIRQIMQASFGEGDEDSFISQLIAASKAGAKIGKKASKKFVTSISKMQK